MLQISDLTASVADKDILEKFNLNLNSGEIHVIMGPNGAGKSTIAKVIMGDEDYTITKGIIKFNDKVINNLTTTEKARLGIFLLSQSPIAIEGVTNAEMLRIALSEKTHEHVKIFEFNKKLETICEELELPKSFIHKSINEGASGGERKKVELLHMWVLEPKLIILDELDSGLDVDALKIVANSILKYYEKFKPTILIITHHTKVLEYLKCDYVHILKNGKITRSGDISLAFEIEESGFTKFNETFNINGNDIHE